MRDSIQGVTPTITGTTTYVNGIYNQAIKFPNGGGGGAGNYLRYTIPSITPTTSLSTITCWLNISTFANYEDIIGISTGSGAANYIEIATSSAGTIYISSAKEASSSIGTSAVTASKWYNIACVINAGNISGYLNGVSFGSFATTESTSFTNMFVATVNGFNGFNGSVQDLRVYNTALTATQIQGIYNSKGIPPTGTLQQVSAPSLLWSFNGTLNDSIINKAPDNTRGTPTYVSGIYNQAVRLNNPTPGSGAQVTTFLQYDNVLPSLTPKDTGQTMACWVKFESVSTSGSQQYFLVWSQSYFYLSGSGQWQTNIYDGGYPAIGYAQVPTVGQWYHAASVFDPTVKFLRLYLNGIQVSVSGSAIIPAFTANPGVRMGSTGYNDNRPGNISLSDVRVYNTALTATQIQGIYNSQGIPPTGTLQQVSNFQYPLSKTSIVSSALGIYSTRSILSTYGGPVVQVRRSSDNTIYDFIADPIGNLSNVQNSTTIASFLSGTTGYIATWYDQSGASNNYSQPTTSKQPQIALNSGKWVMYMPNQSSNLTTQTMSGVMTILVNYNLPSTGYQSILGNVYATDTSLGLRFNGTNVLGDASALYRPGSDFLGSTGSYWYLNNSYGKLVNAGGPPTISENGGYYSPTNWNQVIGTQGTNSFGPNAFNTINPGSAGGRGAGPGYISELMLFSGSISPTDAQIIWNNSPLVNSNPTSFT